MRESYNSIYYWERLINQNKTIRGHMFLDQNPTEQSIYIHTLIFSKNNGIDNVYSYVPDSKMLLGYLQYSFLPEAFYKWIYGKDKKVLEVPIKDVPAIAKDGFKRGSISKEEMNAMIHQYNQCKSLWGLPKEKLTRELVKFARLFNKTWKGDNKEFLYLKIFTDTKELYDFILNSFIITDKQEEFKDRIGVTIEEWEEICNTVPRDKKAVEQFKNILGKKLTEIM